MPFVLEGERSVEETKQRGGELGKREAQPSVATSELLLTGGVYASGTSPRQDVLPFSPTGKKATNIRVDFGRECKVSELVGTALTIRGSLEVGTALDF